VTSRRHHQRRNHDQRNYPCSRPGPELSGQTVIVIGGSAGIRLETARRARGEGAEVILTGRNQDRLSQATAALGAPRSAACGGSRARLRSTGTAMIAAAATPPAEPGG
jgi:NAD(P)-dependent dehydrogenase (short-subunit alcohol dehydrogenase family)